MATEQLTNALHHLRRAASLKEFAGLTDAQLLDHFVGRRDPIAFEALLRRHGLMVLGVCRRVLRNEADAEDAFQATFLVLVKKAATIVPRAMVGNWLYGVAYNTALKARAANGKRRAKEREAAAMSRPAIPDEARRRLHAVLDEELHGLPEKYRVPVVLCDLEGKTRKEAAAQLGWAEGTVASRLARARDLLARRLARHGLPLSAGTLAVSLAESTASASLPAALVERTIGCATVGVIPSAVAALTKGVLQAMFWKKIKATVLVVFAAALLGSGVGAFFSPALGVGRTPEVQVRAAAVPPNNAPPPLDRKRLLEEFARADAVFVGKVAHADLEETFWSGWRMSTKIVVYDVTRFLKGGGMVPGRITTRYLILGGPEDAYYRDGNNPRLNPRLFAGGSEHLVCVKAGGREPMVTFVTPLVKEARATIPAEGKQGKEIPFREIYRSFDGGPKTAAETVVRSQEEWRAFIQTCKERAVRQQLERKQVNFDKEMVVVLAVGPFRDRLTPPEEKETGVKKVLETDDTVWVQYTVCRSDEVANEPAYPVFVTTVPRSKKRVLFEKHETPGG